jgi:SAM-dependent methyltransferase
MHTREEEKDTILHPLTSFVEKDDPLEHQLLVEFDLLAARMGGALAEQSGENLEFIYDVLDLMCGPGGWAHEVARTYPEMSVRGIDRSPTFVRYAQGHAARLELENIQFQVMDMTQPLNLPDVSFDLINVRLLSRASDLSHGPPCWRNVCACCALVGLCGSPKESGRQIFAVPPRWRVLFGWHVMPGIKREAVGVWRVALRPLHLCCCIAFTKQALSPSNVRRMPLISRLEPRLTQGFLLTVNVCSNSINQKSSEGSLPVRRNWMRPCAQLSRR